MFKAEVVFQKILSVMSLLEYNASETPAMMIMLHMVVFCSISFGSMPVLGNSWYLLSPPLTTSALSTWRAANLSAKLASSATSKSSREERWLR